MIAAISSGFGSASGPLDVELSLAGSYVVIDAASQLLANLQVRVWLDASSDGGAGGPVQQSTILGTFVFDPSRMPLMIIEVSVSNSF